MKILKPIFLLLVVTLSGCAHHVGYQRSYVGYGGAYGTGYYDYPYRSYYQTAPIIYNERYYMPARPPRYNWNTRHYSKPINPRPPHKHNYAPRWKPNVSGVNPRWHHTPEYGSRTFHREPVKQNASRSVHGRSNLYHGNSRSGRHESGRFQQSHSSHGDSRRGGYEGGGHHR